MNTRRFLALTAAVASSLAMTGLPAGADAGDCRVIREAAPATDTTPEVQEVSVCREDAFLQTGTSPLANTASAAPTWSTDAPDGATSAYAGLRPVDMMSSSRQVRPTFSGTYTGVLDNIAIDLFISSPVYQTTGTAMSSYNRLTIDGEVIWENATSDDAEIDIPINPVDDTTGKISYAFTDLHKALETYGIENSPTTEHTIEFSLINKYWGDGNFVAQFGSASRPSGLIFNHEPSSRGRLPGYVELDTI